MIVIHDNLVLITIFVIFIISVATYILLPKQNTVKEDFQQQKLSKKQISKLNEKEVEQKIIEMDELLKKLKDRKSKLSKNKDKKSKNKKETKKDRFWFYFFIGLFGLLVLISLGFIVYFLYSMSTRNGPKNNEVETNINSIKYGITSFQAYPNSSNSSNSPNNSRAF